MVKYNWNYDYSQTLWMKLFLAQPDFKNNRSNVFITFEQALEIIKAIDSLTQGIQKIIYLVGWQGLGHDDCYPEMNVVNEALGRTGETARESLFWLFEEAKKYNTVISFHGNIADAYTDTPCFRELAGANAVVNDTDGKPVHIEVFNGRDGYKTSYKQFYESGIFKKLFDRFCEATPVREAGTVHLDNFCIAQNMNPYTSVEEEADARNRILDYIYSLGIDVTTENTYRELELRADRTGHPIREYYARFRDDLPDGDWRDAPFRTLGRIPASWWTSFMTARECIEIPPSLYSGHLTDSDLLRAFYGAMHGEDILLKYGNDPAKWVPEFMSAFCTLQLPYFYLNRYDRLRYEENGGNYRVYFSGNLVSDGETGSIFKDGVALKQGGDVLLPLDKKCETFIAYSENGKSGEWNIPDAVFENCGIFEITPGGNRCLGNAQIKNGKISLNVQPGQALAMKAV